MLAGKTLLRKEQSALDSSEIQALPSRQASDEVSSSSPQAHASRAAGDSGGDDASLHGSQGRGARALSATWRLATLSHPLLAAGGQYGDSQPP